MRRDEGSNLVETAISATVFFAMLFGICQMSYAFYLYQFTSDAARQATRYAMVRGSTCSTNTPSLTNCNATSDQIQTWVRSLHYPGVRSGNLALTTTWCQATVDTTVNPNTTTWGTCSGGTAANPGNLVHVTVSYPLGVTIPWSNNTTLTIGASSSMVISQ